MLLSCPWHSLWGGNAGTATVWYQQVATQVRSARATPLDYILVSVTNQGRRYPSFHGHGVSSHFSFFFLPFFFFIVTHRKGTRYILANVTFTQDGRMAGRLEDLSKRDTFEQTNWIGRYAFRYWRRLETLNFLIDRRDQWY